MVRVYIDLPVFSSATDGLYWAPADIHETRERLERLGYAVSDICERDYGQTEFFLTDDDGYSHCFGVPTKA